MRRRSGEISEDACVSDPSNPTGGATGFTCPLCGGAIWEHPDREEGRFACRIGDAFTALEMWIEHCSTRNRALKMAARALAENAALARHLTDWARKRGDEAMAARLADEAAAEDAAYEQVQAMLDGLGGDESGTTT
jgi:two-component system chemotaxis response regulator CheB